MRRRPAPGGAALTGGPGPTDLPEVPQNLLPTIVTTGHHHPPRRLLRGTRTLQCLVGRTLLVGVTIRAENGRLMGRRQFHGRVSEVSDGVVVLVVGPDGQEVLLPAEPGAYEVARPGVYSLPDGTEIHDPDYLSTWEIAPGPDER